MERKLTAIFSADVQGYSRLMGEDEEATIRTLTAYRAVMTSLIQQHHGRVVDSPGDNLLAEFASAVDAVQGAVAIQRELKTRNAELPASRQMHYRIGINVGDVVVEGERIYGDGVNIAARLESLAVGGGICISGTVYDQVKNKLALYYEYRGEQMVKNITDSVRMYTVELEAEAVAPTMSAEQPATLPLPDKPSIAVLPFANMSGDPEQEYFSDGITEDLITDLSQLSGLFVIARDSTFTYKGKTVRVQEVGRELGVRYVVEGSVRKAGNRVRITVQLVDAFTGGPLWAQRYDRELQDIFAVQDEVTHQVVSALEIKLTGKERNRAGGRGTTSLEAYDYVLRGEEYYLRITTEANAQARRMFEHAIALDPQYADACAFLGESYWMEWFSCWNQNAQTLERALELAERAVALDDTLPHAHNVLSLVYLSQKRHDQAIAAAKRALALDPNYADGYADLGFFLTYAGRPEETFELVEKAMRLNPRYPAYYSWVLGQAHLLTGRYAEGIAALKVSLIRTDFLHSHIDLVLAYSELSRDEEAKTAMAEILRISPSFSLEAAEQILPFRDPAVLERFLVALRKAGLK